MNLSMFPLIIIGLAMFGMILLSGRKQKRLQQQTQELQQDLNDGDVVMTTSGLRATVVDSSYEDTVDLEIAPGVVTTWQRQAIREKVNPTPDTDEDQDTAVVADSHPEALDSGSSARSDSEINAGRGPAGVSKAETDASARD
jgi:preprotein translocase subunit YajC